MGDLKGAVKTAVMTLAIIYVMNQFRTTRNLVQTALNGQ